MSEQIVSQFNGIPMSRHPGISDENWVKTKKQLMDTEGGRLFRTQHTPQETAVAASGATFGMPQSGEWVAEADKKKAEAKIAVPKFDGRTKAGRSAAKAEASGETVE